MQEPHLWARSKGFEKWRFSTAAESEVHWQAALRHSSGHLNNLNQLQLLRLEADGHVPDNTLTLFDDSIRDTAAQLTALGNMEVFAEKPMASGSGLDLSRSSVPR